MTKFLVVGCGDLGGEVAKLLNASGHTVTGVRVSDKLLSNGMSCIQADVTQLASLKALENISPNIIIYCVAANAQSDASYQAHYVEGLNNVLTTQKNNHHLQHVFFISSTRVYGQVANQLLDETVAAMPGDFGGKRLLEAEALLKSLPCSATSIRLSGIYGPGRLYMVNLAKQPGRWPASNQWTNRVHRDDAARFVAFLSEKVIAGKKVEDCYIATDDMPVMQYDVLYWIASKLNVAVPNKNTVDITRGKLLSNKRLRASGFQLTYPNYKVGYSNILEREVLNNV
ncbi:MAG: SDR family oxidoreductase [Methylophilaceae bacterium]